MAIGTTTIPVKGDFTLRKALRLAAAKRGITIAELVRNAIDDAYGEEIATSPVFFTQDGLSVIHMEHVQSGAQDVQE